MIRIRKAAYSTTVILLASTVALAQSVFDGTWETNLSKSKLPDTQVIYEVVNGVERCPTGCLTDVPIATDGADHKVTFSNAFDTENVRIVDSRTIATVYKKNGRRVRERMKRVSDDGKVLTVTATLYPENGAERIVRETKLTRVADGPPGSHAISGTWKRDLADDPASTSTIQIHSTADGISLKSPSLKYTAKLDGKDYPATGDENVSTVSLEPVDGRTLKETDKLQGMVMDVLTMSVSADGRTMTIDDDDKSRNQKATYVMDKQ